MEASGDNADISTDGLAGLYLVEATTDQAASHARPCSVKSGTIPAKQYSKNAADFVNLRHYFFTLN